jgi:hypothetical protein
VVQENEEQYVVGAAVERKRPMTKEDIQKMNLKKKTRKRTRKFEIDGVTVTTTTSKIIYRSNYISLHLKKIYSGNGTRSRKI